MMDGTETRLRRALQAMVDASAKEWLYQTGQTVRPERQYPTQGTVCGELADATQSAVSLLRETEPAK